MFENAQSARKWSLSALGAEGLKAPIIVFVFVLFL